MAQTNRRIIGAFLVGIALVGGAFLISKNSRGTTPEAELAVVTTAQPRSHMEVADSDGDGIPDWQESLQRIEPLELDDELSPYEPPETLTGQFALQFFQDVVHKGKDMDQFDPAALVAGATDSLQKEASDVLLGRADIIISPNNTPESKRVYVNALATIILDQQAPINTPTELEILKRAYETDNPDILSQLQIHIRSYTNVVARMRALPVPSEYVTAHLNLLNTFNAVLNDITAMQLAFSDPLKTIIRLKRYQEDAASIFYATIDLQKVVHADGIEFVATDPIWRLFTSS